eukprot:GHRR01029557.1.p1 GENE.GHRR01029557.1~~GHRR01029557.1.p1  ORF type:complete len:156 (-),score=34.85 GHRR01029557.1:149-616(-)
MELFAYMHNCWLPLLRRVLLKVVSSQSVCLLLAGQVELLTMFFLPCFADWCNKTLYVALRCSHALLFAGPSEQSVCCWLGWPSSECPQPATHWGTGWRENYTGTVWAQVRIQWLFVQCMCPKELLMIVAATTLNKYMACMNVRLPVQLLDAGRQL